MSRPTIVFLLGACLGLAACEGASTPPPATGADTAAADTTADTTADTATPSACPLAANTVATSTVHGNGCALLSRDTTACEADRKAQGLTGFWLKFSCRVQLTATTVGGVQVVQAAADGRPDYPSFYFATSDACYEAYPGGFKNPNQIKTHSTVLNFPAAPDTSPKTTKGTPVIGFALNGVALFDNAAAPGDDIYTEAKTFDRCGAHPEMTGRYHYHSEPYAISNDDANFIGVMLDGYPIYGRKDPDGSAPVLDAQGGHLGVTVDSPATPVYHYHLNEQTSTATGTKGEKQWFLSKGTFHGTPGTCTGCK